MESPSYSHITSAEVSRTLYDDLSLVSAALEKALASFSAKDGTVVQPVRATVSVPSGLFFTMPGFSQSENIFTTKIVTVFPDNHKYQLPAIQAQVFVYSSETGSLKAIVDGNELTAIRTAAVSGIATKYLAPVNSKILAILGAGVQARSHFKVLSKICQFDEVKIWNHREESGRNLVTEIREMGAKCNFFGEAKAAVENADVVVTCTLSQEPILKGAWLKPGAHVNAVGAANPLWRELDDQLMKEACIYVDTEEGARVESGDIILSKASIYAEIGEVILRKKQAFRESVTLFKSQGMAIQDTIAASFVYKQHVLNN